MKKNSLLIILTLALLLAIYLNRSYAFFFDYIGSHFAGNPNYVKVTDLGDKKNAKTLKILTIGDSLLAGTCATDKSRVLANLIAQSFISNDLKVNLVNLAVPGAGVKDVLEDQVPEAITHKPDFIILMIGVNDVHDLVRADYFRKYYDEILEKLVLTKAEITLINIPYLGSDLVLFPPWNINIDLETRNFNFIIGELAREKGLKVVNIYDKFSSEFKKSSKLYCSDQFHPSDEGYKVWSEYINANITR